MTALVRGEILVAVNMKVTVFQDIDVVLLGKRVVRF
jgi:hypothetical protein